MFKAIHTSNGYYLRAKNLSGKGRALMMKFDTGAVNTVISVEALTKRKIDKAWIVQSIQDKTPCRKFKSASGNEMTGYLVHVDNADIAGSRIERFYYYMIMNVDNAVSLIGDDFISKCTFLHSKDGDIEVTAFDSIGYHADTIKSISETELDELLELSVIGEDVSEAQ